MRKLRGYRAIVMFFTLVLALPLTGCWDRKEVNEIAIVISKGIDLTDDNRIKVSVQVAIPSKVGGQTGGGSGGDGKSFFVVSGVGRTISEADLRIQQQLPRQMYLSHLRLILIGDRVARERLVQVLDHYGRNPPERLRTAFLIAKDTDAYSFLKSSAPLENISGESIRKLERQLIGVNTTLMDFLIEAASEGSDQYASAISLVPEKNLDDSSSEQQPDKKISAIANQAVFRDLRMVGYLDIPKSVALLWMNQRLRYVTLTTGVPGSNGAISVVLTQARRRVQSYVTNHRVKVKYSLSGSAMLVDNTTGLDADDPTTLKKFQAAINEYVEKISNECLDTLFHKFDSDPTGVGTLVYRQHSYQWESLKSNWRENIRNINYSVTSEVKIVEGGKSGPPLFGKIHRGILNDKQTIEKVGGSEE